MERQLTLRMLAELAQKLERAARQLRRRRSEVVRLALEQFLTEDVLWKTRCARSSASATCWAV